MHPSRHRLGGVALGWIVAAVIAGAWLAAAPAPAHALVDAACLGPETNSFSPGLTNRLEPHDVTYSASLSCLSLTDPAIRGATVRGFVSGALRSCTSLLNVNTTTADLTWNTGERSVMRTLFTPNYADGQLVIVGVGTVTSGKFAGSAVASVEAIVADLLACGSPGGLTRLDGVWRLDVAL